MFVINRYSSNMCKLSIYFVSWFHQTRKIKLVICFFGAADGLGTLEGQSLNSQLPVVNVDDQI